MAGSAQKAIEIPIVNYPSSKATAHLKKLESLCADEDGAIAGKVASVLLAIRRTGDKALFAYTREFDTFTLTQENIRISPDEIIASAKKIPPRLARAIDSSAKRIKEFHKNQGLASFSVKTKGAVLAQLIRPLHRVGCYIPGGHALYPSSILMNLIPAQLAGVSQLVAVTPPHKILDSGVAFALALMEVTEVYRIGGAQAIGALAYGTSTIRAVDKIVGPGNAYVAAAKKQVYGTVDIDTIAGPSEVVIVADKHANPRMVALDLLAQAEHGSGREIALLVTENASFAQTVVSILEKEISISSKREVFARLLPGAISVFVTPSRADTFEFVNERAPEHLEIMTDSALKDLEKVRNAGAVFLGGMTPVALGDYSIGTNHVLPTGKASRFSSPLGVESFQKRMSVAYTDRNGLEKFGDDVSVFARAEGFVHHALCVEERMKESSEAKEKSKKASKKH